MKHLLLIIGFLALRPTLGFYSQEVQFLFDSLNSYMSTIESQINQLFPYWDQVFDSYKTLGEYASFSNPELADYVITYRNNYTDFAKAGLSLVNEAKTDILRNWTFWKNNFKAAIDEADQGVQFSTQMLRKNGCANADVKSYIFSFTSNMSNEISFAVGEQLIGYQYLYGIIGQKSLPSFAQLATSIFADPHDPLYRLKQVNSILEILLYLQLSSQIFFSA